MIEFSEKFLGSLVGVNRFILKDRFLSCGIKNVKVYLSLKLCSSIERTRGFFAQYVQERFRKLAVESESRLSNYRTRRHFLLNYLFFTILEKLNQVLKCEI